MTRQGYDVYNKLATHVKDKGSSPELFVQYEIGKYVLGDGGTAR